MGGVRDLRIDPDARVNSLKIGNDPHNWGNVPDRITLTTGVDPTAVQLAAIGITVANGMRYYHPVDHKERLYANASWTDAGTAAAGSLDSSYDYGGAGAGRTLTVDQGALQLNGTHATNDSFFVNKSAGTGAAIQVTSSGTASGEDFAGTGGLFNVAASGAVVCVGLTDTAGITTDTSITASGTGTLAVGGASTLSGIVTAGVDINIAGDLTVGDDVTVTGDLSVGGTLTATVAYGDGAELTFGAGHDLGIKEDTGVMYMGTDTDNTVLHIGDDGTKYTKNLDITVYGSASTKTIVLDSSADKVTINDIDWVFGDADSITLGDGVDLLVASDGTDIDVTTATDGTIINIGDASLDFDVIWNSSANNVTMEVSTNVVTFNGVDLYMDDDDNISFGDSQDVVAQWAAGGGFNITGAAADSVITVGADGANTFDLVWHGGTASADITLDASEDTISLDGVDLYLEDLDTIEFGDDNDFILVGTSNALSLKCAANNDKLTIGWQTGAEFDMDVQIQGSAAANFALFDGSDNVLTLDNYDIAMGDADLITLGDSADFTLTGTTNALSLYGVADADVFTVGWQTGAEFDMDVQIRGDAAANYVLIDASANELSLVNNMQLILGPTRTPAAAAAYGTAGELAWDTGYLYLCTATNTWERIATTGGY